MSPTAMADLEDWQSDPSIDPLIFPPEDADEKLKKLWNLHGPPHAPRYADPKLTSLNALVQHQAETCPEKPAYLYPVADDFVVLSWTDLQAIVLKASAYYGSVFKKDLDAANASGKQPTIAMLAVGTTIEYWIALLALLKLHIRVLVLSNKNALVAHRHLLSVCEATGLVLDTEDPALQAIVSDKEHREADDIMQTLNVVSLSSIDEVKSRDEVQESSIYDLSFKTDDEWNLHSMIIHSSGSTGMPKPIIHTNRSLCLIAKNYRYLPEFYIEHWYLCSPLFHIGGVSVAMGGLPNGLPTTFPVRQWPPAPSALLTAWKKLTEIGMPIDCVQIAPSMVQDMYTYIAETTNDFSALRKLKVIQSGGAAFAPSLLAKLTDLGVNMKTTYGSTEIAAVMRTIPHNYHNPSNYYKMRNLYADTGTSKMDPLGDGTFECVVYKGYPLAAELWLKPDAPNPFRTNDVFIEDPPNSGFFVLLGRKDDVVVHSNGEKTQAGSVQNELEDSDPIIRKAAVFGTNQTCTAAILELAPEAHDLGTPEQVEAKVWDVVQRANEKIAKHSQFARSMVHILKKGEALPLTPKGNVKRNAAGEQYAETIKALYSRYLNDADEEDEGAAGLSDSEYVQSAVAGVCEVPLEEISPITNLYSLGLDSQKAIRLRSKLVKRFGNFPVMFIFEYPTLEELGTYLANRSTNNTTNAKDEARLQWMQDTVAQYNKVIDSWKVSKQAPTEVASGQQQIVYLTGANGALGNALIEVFVANPAVSKIYCACRGKDAHAKILESLKSRGYDSSVYDSAKIVGVPYDMMDENLGLSADKYAELLGEVTTVVHNAWRLDFNQPVELFQPDCLQGAMNLLQFCYSGTSKTFSFVSSISTVMGKALKDQSEIPETPVGDDPAAAGRSGYARSKWVVERITQHYAETLSMPVRLLRVGQLCGHSASGVWNTTEAWPILIATGLDHLNALPLFPGKKVNWLAVDSCAKSAGSIVAPQSPNPAQNLYTVNNLSNPSLVSWDDLLGMLAEASGRSFERITMSDWVGRLEKVAGGEGKVDVPGLKLLGFYQNMAAGESSEVAGQDVDVIAKSVIGAEPLRTKAVEMWLRSWRDAGFIR